METLIKNFLSISIEPFDNQLYSNSAGSSITAGNGFGMGAGEGNLDGSGYGRGNKAFNGMGWDNFLGEGKGKPLGIKEINGDSIHLIDSKQVFISKLLSENLAQGYILNQDLSTTFCYIAKGYNTLALGSTIQEAQNYVKERRFDHLSEDERFNLFVDKFPELDTPYKAVDVFAYHHIITGSCAKGRIDFLKQHNITQNTTGTIREFFKLLETNYSRGHSCIPKLLKIYGERNKLRSNK